MAFLHVFVLILLVVSVVQASKWRLNKYLEVQNVLTFTEEYMFANENGPPMLEQGSAYIDIDVRYLIYMKRNESALVAYAIFTASGVDNYRKSLEGMCEAQRPWTSWSSNIRYGRVATSYIGEAEVDDPANYLTGNYFLWHAPMAMKYSITAPGWHNVNFQVCTDAVGYFDGRITFRNPYGFIPSELYGFLPFEGARMVAYFFLGIVYSYYFWKHQKSTLSLHQGVLFVFFVALAEATCWYAAYQSINLSGEPFCCPFPTSVITSLVLQIFRQTFSRSLLLVVSLGYGIVRPKLMSAEWIAVAVISVLYFMGATIAQIPSIEATEDRNSFAVLAYQMPGLFMDVIFLTWILLALGSTIRILTESQEGHKLNLYKQLGFIIVLFVSLFAMASIFILLDKYQFITWPVQFLWFQQVLWEVLNFSVLAAVMIICVPSDNSRRLTYASQLPTDDPEAVESDQREMIHGEIEAQAQVIELATIEANESNDIINLPPSCFTLNE